jgi:hypothetical protein
MDYDQSGIATTYDEARALTPARRRRWQRLLSAHVDRTAIALVVGLISERYISENNQRLFYRRWEEFMNAESWVDISLDAITARFDGTATMQG